MHIRQLMALRAVISSGTTTQAAEVLGVTQPAVSSLIATLEKEVGFKLFERVKGRLVPTLEADRMAEEAERTIASFRRMEEMAHDLRQLAAGQLRIACMPGIALDFMPRVLARFQADKPDIKVSLQIRSSMRVREWISAQYFDLGIAELPVDDPAIEVEPLQMRCVCVMPEKHPLARKKVITPQDLDEVPFISLNGDHMTYFRIADAFEEAGAKLNVRAEVQLFAPACAMVASGGGVSIVDPVSAKVYEGRGIAVRPFRPAIRFDVGLMFPAYRPRSLLMQNFVTTLKQAMQPYLL